MSVRPIVSATLLISVFVLMPAAYADIYKIVDRDGNVTFTDRYLPGAIRVVSDNSPNRQVSTRSRRSNKSSAANPTPANFPKVDSKTQTKRDSLRRQILLDELASEEKMLTEAKAMLAADSTKGMSTVKFNEAAQRHQQNIDMLNKELSRLK